MLDDPNHVRVELLEGPEHGQENMRRLELACANCRPGQTLVLPSGTFALARLPLRERLAHLWRRYVVGRGL